MSRFAVLAAVGALSLALPVRAGAEPPRLFPSRAALLLSLAAPTPVRELEEPHVISLELQRSRVIRVHRARRLLFAGSSLAVGGATALTVVARRGGCLDGDYRPRTGFGISASFAGLGLAMDVGALARLLAVPRDVRRRVPWIRGGKAMAGVFSVLGAGVASLTALGLGFAGDVTRCYSD